MSVCLSVCPPARPSVRLSVYLSVRLSVCLSVRLSLRPSVCPSVCLSVRLSVRPSVCLFFRLSVRLPACLDIYYYAGLCFLYTRLISSATFPQSVKEDSRQTPPCMLTSFKLQTEGFPLTPLTSPPKSN
jgi:hypothetical protein